MKGKGRGGVETPQRFTQMTSLVCSHIMRAWIAAYRLYARSL